MIKGAGSVPCAARLEQFRELHVFNVAADDFVGFPAAGLHDRQQVEAVEHEILRAADAHGMAGQALRGGFWQAGVAGHGLDDPVDR